MHLDSKIDYKNIIILIIQTFAIRASRFDSSKRSVLFRITIMCLHVISPITKHCNQIQKSRSSVKRVYKNVSTHILNTGDSVMITTALNH